MKGNASAKFDETVEVALNLGVDPRHADQMVRGIVNLPRAPARTSGSRCSPRATRPTRLKAAGADKVGAEDLMEDMQAGNLDFDRVIATPDMMGVVGRLGKVLGPKGLMPNPKLGTVTPNVDQGGQGRQGRPGRIPRREGRASSTPASARPASPKASSRRISTAFIDAIVKAKPTGAKGKYVKKIASAPRWARA